MTCLGPTVKLAKGYNTPESSQQTPEDLLPVRVVQQHREGQNELKSNIPNDFDIDKIDQNFYPYSVNASGRGS